MAINALLAQQANLVIPRFARDTMTSIRAELKSRRRVIEVKRMTLFQQLTQRWLAQRKTVASSIAQTTLNDVLNAVQDGVDAGDGNDAIATSASRT